MLFLLTFLVVSTAFVLLAIFVKRQISPSLPENQPKNLSAENFRPLFEPTEDEIRAFEQAEKRRIEAEKRENDRRILEAKAEQVREFQKDWQNLPNNRNTVQLLYLASQSENAKTFSETVENVIKLWRENRIKNLSATDLAELLDSHFRTLPQQERTSGTLFWLKEEIAELRGSKSEELS